MRWHPVAVIKVGLDRAGVTEATSQSLALEKVLSYSFHDPAVLQQALVHASYLHEHPGLSPISNERLEFLGDSFLDYVIAAELYRRLPLETEGVLTKLRAVVVQGASLAKAAETLGLGQFLKLARGEQQAGGRDRPSNLADAYEAVLGAILVDGGEGPAKAFVLRTLDELLSAAVSGSINNDYKSLLQEYCQARKWHAPLYLVVGEEGKPHAKRFSVQVQVGDKVMGKGTGASKQSAEKAAAKEAMGRLSQLEAPLP